MPTLKAYIVGRQAEMAQFAEFAACRTSYRILNYYGPAGIGKTVLCKMMESFCEQRNIPFASVAGDRPDLAPAHILHTIAESLKEHLDDNVAENIFHEFDRRYRDYLVLQDIVQRQGGISAMFDAGDNIKNPPSLLKLLSEAGEAISQEVFTAFGNRFALERYLHGAEKALTDSLTSTLAKMLAKIQPPIILLFDAYERLEGLDDWICRGLVPALPDGIKLVIFGRNRLHQINFDWSDYSDLIHAEELPELSEAEAKAYLRRHGLQDETALDEVYRFAGGYPLALVLVVDLSRDIGSWERIRALRGNAARDFVAHQLLERILREKQVAEVQAFLEKGVVARWFDPETISVVLEVSLDEGRTIYDKLRRYSFIRPHQFGLQFHDTVRELLLERLKFTNETEYKRVIERLMAYYAGKAGIALPPSEEKPEGELPAQAKYTIHIESAEGIVIGDQAWTTQVLNLAEMLAFGGINAEALRQDLASLLGLSQLPHDAPYRSDVYPALFDATPLFSGTRSLAHLPFLFIQASTFLQISADELRQYLHQIMGPAHRIFVFIYWTELDTPKQAASSKTVVKKLQQVWAYDCVLLGREELQKIVFSADPKAVFRKLVLGQIDLTNITPFITWGATSDEMFFGREKELREITEHAATASYALIGGRRIGKTSILKRLERVRLPAAGFLPLYHDCSFTPTQTELVQAMAADKSWFPEPPAIPPASFASVIQVLPDDESLVILLDEADKLIEPDRRSGYPLFNTLRAMANADRCRFVLSGEQALRTELTNPNSPLYNFANEMLIGRLDFRAVEELVTRPMKQLEIELADEAEIVQHIWDFTSGHPNVVQRFCQRLIVSLNERGNRRLTLNDIEAVVADPDFLRKDFLNIYWERATALERLCSLVMAADDNARTLTAVHEALTSHAIEVTLNQVDDALERLVDLRNILQRTAEGYEFAVTAFPEVIAKTARLDDLISLNCETYQRHGDVEPRSKRGVS